MTTGLQATEVRATGRQRRAARSDADRAARPGVLWVLPAVAFFGVFAGLPLLLVAVLSFTTWDGLSSPRFNGLDNWTRLLHDSSVLESLRISAVLTILNWALQTPLSLLLGVWAAGWQRNRAVLSSIFFLPLLMSTAAIAITWLTLLDPNFGLAAKIGPWIGLEDGNIIGSSNGALACVLLVLAWQFVPLHTLLYQGAARQVPQVLYDAAAVDGATRYQQFRHITLPQLRNRIITSSVLMLVGSLTYFETVLILTAGGPGTSTNILPHKMYVTAFRDYHFGYASVISLALVALGTTLSLLIVRFTGYGRMRSTLEGL